MKKSLLGLAKRLLSDKSYDECRFSGVIPCIDESYSIYLLILHLLETFIVDDVMVNEYYDKLQTCITKFYEYYPQIRQFYSVCNSIFYVKNNVIQLPSLPEDPPVLILPDKMCGEKTVEEKPKKKKKKKNNKQPKDQNQTTGQIFSFGISQPQVVNYNNYNPYEHLQENSLPDFGLEPQLNPQDFFTDLLNTYISTPSNTSNSTTIITKKKIKKTENLDKLRERIHELENLIKKIKAKIKDLEGQNKELETLLR